MGGLPPNRAPLPLRKTHLAGARSDPKELHNTLEEERQYDERCRQIARKMVWGHGRVRDQD